MPKTKASGAPKKRKVARRAVSQFGPPDAPPDADGDVFPVVGDSRDPYVRARTLARYFANLAGELEGWGSFVKRTEIDLGEGTGTHVTALSGDDLRTTEALAKTIGGDLLAEVWELYASRPSATEQRVRLMEEIDWTAREIAERGDDGYRNLPSEIRLDEAFMKLVYAWLDKKAGPKPTGSRRSSKWTLISAYLRAERGDIVTPDRLKKDWISHKNRGR